MTEGGESPAATGPIRIALDGPAAAGKSTVGRRLAVRLGCLYFDTGALYRALTVTALERNIHPADGDALAEVVRGWHLEVLPSDTELGYSVRVDDTDISSRLRESSVDAAVAEVSRHPAVREALLAGQRQIARRAVVMVGRDIGTVVLPDAEIKLYLDASPEERARRRLRERLAKGEADDFARVLAAMRDRDATDAARSTAPLAKADDAVIVDTDRCDADAVVEHLLRLVKRWPDDLTQNGGELPCRQN